MNHNLPQISEYVRSSLDSQITDISLGFGVINTPQNSWCKTFFFKKILAQYQTTIPLTKMYPQNLLFTMRFTFIILCMMLLLGTRATPLLAGQTTHFSVNSGTTDTASTHSKNAAKTLKERQSEHGLNVQLVFIKFLVYSD